MYLGEQVVQVLIHYVLPRAWKGAADDPIEQRRTLLAVEELISGGGEPQPGPAPEDNGREAIKESGAKPEVARGKK